MQEAKDWFGELIKLMARLRAPDGCPWDRKQTHRSMQRYLWEETAELAEAIEADDRDAIRDELGDVLLQVVFHAQMAQEAERFDAQDVARTVCEKLIRRHPHVFGQSDLRSAGEVAIQWEAIKKQERRDRGQAQAGALDGVPRTLSALHRAYKVQKKAARVGFEWPTVDGVIGKIREELDELCEALEADDQAAVAEEIGDLLFSVTNISRFLGHFPEDALHQTVHKFEHRFRCLEAWLAQEGRIPSDCSLEELEALWQRAKAFDKKEANPADDLSEETGERG